jgi:hypothetical protein
MTNVLPLWRIEEELEALVNSVDTCPEELRPELEARITEFIGAEINKVDHVSEVFGSLDNVVESAKREINRLRERQQSAERTKEQLAKYVLHVLRERNGRPLKGHNCTFTVRHSEVLIIDDPSVVPDQFKRTTIAVDVPKDAVKRAIKAGETVPGAHIEQHENLVRK